MLSLVVLGARMHWPVSLLLTLALLAHTTQTRTCPLALSAEAMHSRCFVITSSCALAVATAHAHQLMRTARSCHRFSGRYRSCALAVATAHVPQRSIPLICVSGRATHVHVFATAVATAPPDMVAENAAIKRVAAKKAAKPKPARYDDISKWVAMASLRGGSTAGSSGAAASSEGEPTQLAGVSSEAEAEAAANMEAELGYATTGIPCAQPSPLSVSALVGDSPSPESDAGGWVLAGKADGLPPPPLEDSAGGCAVAALVAEAEAAGPGGEAAAQ
eukprot:952081-Alexandrium_andersonii.AAC.1